MYEDELQVLTGWFYVLRLVLCPVVFGVEGGLWKRTSRKRRMSGGELSRKEALNSSKSKEEGKFGGRGVRAERKG